MIARAVPGVRVRVFDLPQVIDGTNKPIEEGRLKGRIEAIAGSFFEQVPEPADLCVLKHIIHDWDDDLSRRILQRIAGMPSRRVAAFSAAKC